MVSFMSRTRRCGLPSLATAMAASRSRSSGASVSTRPISFAALAPTCSPEVIISSARSTPTMRGRRCVPPAPGMSPSLTSGRPHLADGTATR
jgi:hypothetical protein